MKNGALVFFLLAAGLMLSGCATVQPWDRELLAAPAMQVDPNPIQSGFDDHIYFSIEGSSGGRTFGGGGCGCN